MRVPLRVPESLASCLAVLALFNVAAALPYDRCAWYASCEGFWNDARWVPLHAASFCLKTGKALCLPATDPLTTYPVHVEGGDILLPGRAMAYA
ncbi:hypothetical protein [Escherichia coli]|uniref:hypothetical protein n=1 Tax=Escherichia coli TaxID=562 RepID=UPI003B429B0A